MIIAVDLDGMLFAFPDFFQKFFPAMQSQGNKVGILSARPDGQKEEVTNFLKENGIAPDFFIGMPEDKRKEGFSQGIFKAVVCNELGVDILFDDFQYNDSQMLADFFTWNNKTTPFTGWAYRPQ